MLFRSVVSAGATSFIRVVYTYRDTSTDQYSVLGARLVCLDASGYEVYVHLYLLASALQKTSSDVLVVTWTIDLPYQSG